MASFARSPPSRASACARRTSPRSAARRPPAGWLEVHSENYFVDGGPALVRARDDPHRLPDFPARRRSVAGIGGPARRRAPRTAEAPCCAHRAVGGVRAPVLEPCRRPPSERSPAAAAYRRGAGAGVRSRGRGAIRAGPSVAGRERVLLFALCGRHDGRMGLRRRCRHEERLQAAVRRQQRLRQRGQSRLRRAVVCRGDPARQRRRDPSRRIRRQRAVPDRHHGSRVAPPVWALYRARDRAFRAQADADRMGHRHSGARGTAGRGRQGAGNSRTSIAMPSLRESSAACPPRRYSATLSRLRGWVSSPGR